MERYIHRFADTNKLRTYVQFNATVDSVNYNLAERTGTISVTDTITGLEGDQRFSQLVVWNSRAHAEAAADVIGPQLLPVVNAIAKGPLKPVTCKVHQSLV